jgi:hypothetical protein
MVRRWALLGRAIRVRPAIRTGTPPVVVRLLFSHVDTLTERVPLTWRLMRQRV